MLVQRYLLRIIALRGLLALLALACVYLAFDLGDQGRRLAATLGWRTVLWATLLHLPLMAAQLLPVALLLGGALALAALRRRGELEALSASGLTPLALGLPLLLLGVFFSLAGWLLGNQLAPAFEQRADSLYQHRRISALTGELPRGRWYRARDGRGGSIFVARSATRLTLLRVDAQSALQQRVEGRIVGPTTLANVWVYTLATAGRRSQRRHQAKLELPELASLAQLWQRQGGRAESLDGDALGARLDAARAAGQRARVDALMLQGRRAFPALGLVVALLLWGFALAPARSSARQLALAVGWVALLWATLSAGWLLARGGALGPLSGAWAPIVLAAALALTELARRWPRARRVLL